jgi:crotonobetainyl-CoA hydratase
MGVNVSSDDRHVRIVEIDRADCANAIDLDLARQLSVTFDEIEADDAVRAVVLTASGGRVFCAGMDLGAVAAGEADAINSVPGGFAGIVRRDLAKPVVAAVDGAAFGGGFEIVLACDLVVASETARFALPEVTKGLLAASGGAVRLATRIPTAVAMEHLLLGEPITADRALQLDLVNAVVPPADVLPTALALAGRLAEHPPAAVQAAKRVARTALARGEAEAWSLNDRLARELSAAFGSPDAG